MTGEDSRAVEYVRAMIADILESRAIARGQVPSLTDELDLRDAGLIDSLGFVQLIAELELQLGRSIDLSTLNAESLTHVGALARHIARDTPPQTVVPFSRR